MSENTSTGLEVAVIGIAAKFPGANDHQAFWENICGKKETISFFQKSEMQDHVVADMLANPGFVSAKGIIQDYDHFDNVFFGFTETEANRLEPQVRLFYELVWHALEDAGCIPDRTDDRIGFYAGITDNLAWKLGNHLQVEDATEHFELNTLTKTFFNTLLSYKLNLKGPSVFLQTACSTSLVAVHIACQGLISGDCDIAIAGGATVIGPDKDGYIYNEGMILSKDGHCRPFDNDATGTVFSQGIGVVVLKRLEDAVAAGDHIYAIVKGTAVNNDGYRKSGYTAPSATGQMEVITAALQMADVPAESINYVECHGTGTRLGDPIEIEGLKQAFNTDKTNYCAIGSVKANIGHTDAAAGIAGFIKTVLALHHRKLPPALHFNKLNTAINLINSPFYVNTELKEWPIDHNFPRRAGVSAFGIGGTNAHAILEEYIPDKSKRLVTKEPSCIIVSAKCAQSLATAEQELLKWLQTNQDLCLADIAYSYLTTRTNFRYRTVIAADTVPLAVNLLLDNASTLQRNNGRNLRYPVFLFPGQGSQYVNMGRDLYQSNTTFRAAMEECFGIMLNYTGTDFKQILYPAEENDEALSGNTIQQTAIAQPLLFSISYALAKLLIQHNVQPYAMIGHSLGEYVAACLSGVMSLHDTLQLVCERGALMQQVDPGGMLSVVADFAKLSALLLPGVDIAAINGPDSHVISGSMDLMLAMEQQLQTANISYVVLKTSHAFHSEMMEEITEAFHRQVSAIKLNAPIIPYISNVTGKWTTAEEATSADYWVKHLRQPVQFWRGIETLQEEIDLIYLEIGPGNTLGSLIKSDVEKREEAAIQFIRHPKAHQNDEMMFFKGLSTLCLFGLHVNWGSYAGMQGNKIPLPKYPLQRKPFISDYAQVPRQLKLQNNINHALKITDSEREDITKWCYRSLWKQAAIIIPQNISHTEKYLIFHDEMGLSKQLIPMVNQKGVTDVYNNRLSCNGETIFLPQLVTASAYMELFRELKHHQQLPDKIFHCLNIYNEQKDLETAINYSFYSLIYLCQAIGNSCPDHPIELVILSNEMFSIVDEQAQIPEKAMLLGPGRILAKEYNNIRVRLIDIDNSFLDLQKRTRLLNLLSREIQAPLLQNIVALRGWHRWVQEYEQIPMTSEITEQTGIASDKVYMLTGGLGSLGFELAKHLLLKYKAKLLLFGRTVLDEEDQAAWSEDLQTKKERYNYLRQLSHDVYYVPVDIQNEARVREEVVKFEGACGMIDGVFHTAGVSGGGLIQLKENRQIEAVFGSKVQGVLVLEQLFKDRQLDFFTVFSSISSIVPVLGGVEYNAANAFLDAFILSRPYGKKYQTINWDAWKEGGMAVVSNVNEGKILTKGKLFQQIPVYRQVSSENRNETNFYFELDFTRDWFVNEHIFDNAGVVPAAAYFDLLWEILKQHLQIDKHEILDLNFVAPLSVSKDEKIQVKCTLNTNGIVTEFTFSSSTSGEIFENNVKGKVRPLSRDMKPEPADFLEPDANWIIKNQGNESISSSGLLTFGPRWKNAQALKVQGKYGYAALKLPPEYLMDTTQYQLHAALIDKGTGFLSRILSDKNYFPFSYQRVSIYGALTASVYCYSRLVEQTTGSIVLDVRFVNEDHEVLIDIKGFTLLEYNPAMKRRQSSTTMSAGKVKRMLEQNLGDKGIGIAEGIKIMEQIIASNSRQIIVSTINLQKRLIAGVEQQLEQKLTIGATEDPTFSEGFSITEKIIFIWENILGLKQIKLTDNYFDLGGDSLKAILISNKIVKELKVQLTLPVFFKYPTILEQVTYIEGQSAQENAVTSFRVFGKKELYQTTYTEKQLYFLQHFDPATSVANLPDIMEIDGPLETGKVSSILKQLITRHEAFRTVYLEKDGDVYRKILDHIDFEMTEQSCNEADWADIAANLVQPFDLAAGPLIRAHLLKISQNRHILFIDVNHIVYDGTSIGIILNEFVALYKGESLPPLDYFFRDYAEQLNTPEWIKQIEEEREYWLRRLDKHQMKISLPYDRERPLIQQYNGSSWYFSLTIEETEKLKALSREQDVTLFVLLLSIYNVFLQKLTNQDDFVIGVPVSGRNGYQLQQMVGNLLNFLPMRNKPQPEQSFLSFLQAVKDTAMEDFANQQYPLGMLIADLNLERNAGHNPLFDLMFIFHNEYMGEIDSIDIDELSFKKYPLLRNTSMYDLTLKAIELGKVMNFSFEYTTALFDHATIQNFGNYLLQMIRTILANPNRSLQEYSILNEDQQKELVYAVNDNSVTIPEKSISELFGQQAVRSPDLPALIIGDDVLTYNQLQHKVNTLAAYLQLQLQADEAIIGVLMNRSADLIVALFAILRLHKSYLPIDPDYPAERIQYMITHSNVRTVMVDSHTERMVKIRQPINVADQLVCATKGFIVDEGFKSLEAPAYLIYTSGSTGNPKGIQVSQRNVLNFILGFQSIIDFSAGKRTFSLTTISFDIFVLEIFIPLLSGGCVILNSSADQLDTSRIKQIVVSRQVAILQLTPSRLRMLLDDKQYDFLQGVSEILIGGESLPLSLLQELKQHFNGKIFNVYGPTETTVWSSVKELTATNNISIGKPIVNTRFYVVDAHLNLVPSGVVGELLIGGLGVAIGYYQQDELTVRKFIANPFLEKGERVFCTGDLVKRLANGEFVYVGRNDQQVKIRGYRVEIEEIEEVMLKFPGIQEAVVYVNKEESMNSLHAYLKLAEAVDITRLRAYLHEHLPSYMIPAGFYSLDKMPLTSNNKIDKNALSKLGVQIHFERKITIPSTETEEVLLRIWQDILPDREISLEDSFFEVGGNSFLLGKLKMNISTNFGVDVPIALFFQYTSISAIARHIINLKKEPHQNQYQDNTSTVNKNNNNRMNATMLKLRKK